MKLQKNGWVAQPIKASECAYKEKGGRLKEPFINDMSDD